MTCRVRWNTEFEEDDIQRLLAEHGDDFAIALDRNGWQIVTKPQCRGGGGEDSWQMNEPTDACPVWAKAPAGEPKVKIRYEPYPELPAELSRLNRS
jgi:hypothetical protein